MSPKSSRAQQRQRRNLLISVLAVVCISLGSFAAVFAAQWTPKLGLDLAGGLSVVYKAEGKVSPADLTQVVNIMNNRVNGLGVSGAQVSTTGTNQISVSVPGVKNASVVLNDIGKTAQLFFRPVLCYAYPFIPEKPTKKDPHPTKPTPGTATLPGCGKSYATTVDNLGVSPSKPNGNNIGADPQYAETENTPTTVKDYPHRDVLLPVVNSKGEASTSLADRRYVLGPEELTGKAISSAIAQQNQTGQWVVNYTLKGPANSAKWDTVAENNFHSLLAIELDGIVYSAPLIQPDQSTFTSFDGQGEISGTLTQADAESLAQALNFGSLPIPLKQETAQTITPTLGKSALKAGLGAGIAGLALVLLYVLIYYRALGLVVISGLALTAALLWAIISALGHTTFSPSFDLAGITGLIVSIGITVDSYIVYFERLKDETRAGRSVRTSVDRGFKSAWRTVWAADFVSLLAAVVLYILAVGDVKGFAFFLGLSTILDMAITWFYTRPLVILLGRNDRLTQAGRFGIARGLAVQAQPTGPSTQGPGQGPGQGQGQGPSSGQGAPVPEVSRA